MLHSVALCCLILKRFNQASNINTVNFSSHCVMSAQYTIRTREGLRGTALDKHKSWGFPLVPGKELYAHDANFSSDCWPTSEKSRHVEIANFVGKKSKSKSISKSKSVGGNHKPTRFGLLKSELNRNRIRIRWWKCGITGEQECVVLRLSLMSV